MIPKIIHSCWFGKGTKPELVERCVASWHACMPCVSDSESESRWIYMEWSEDNFDISSAPLYVRQAYKAKKYAFVSDYVRLWALEQYGGVYLDVDFEVYQSFEPLLNSPAFAGWQGSKRIPVMMGVIASEPHNPWIKAMLNTYTERAFIKKQEIRKGKQEIDYDTTPNTEYFTDWMISQGFVCDGVEKDWCPIGETSPWVHIYPVEYFCPGLTTGENIRSEHTYCEHKGLHSWSGNGGWKARVLSMVGTKWKARIIKFKRKLLE